MKAHENDTIKRLETFYLAKRRLNRSKWYACSIIIWLGLLSFGSSFNSNSLPIFLILLLFVISMVVIEFFLKRKALHIFENLELSLKEQDLITKQLEGVLPTLGEMQIKQRLDHGKSPKLSPEMRILMAQKLRPLLPAIVRETPKFPYEFIFILAIACYGLGLPLIEDVQDHLLLEQSKISSPPTNLINKSQANSQEEFISNQSSQKPKSSKRKTISPSKAINKTSSSKSKKMRDQANQRRPQANLVSSIKDSKTYLSKRKRGQIGGYASKGMNIKSLVPTQQVDLAKAEQQRKKKTKSSSINHQDHNQKVDSQLTYFGIQTNLSPLDFPPEMRTNF